MEVKNCPLGCSPDDTLVMSGRDRLHNRPGIFQIVMCKTCGLMRTNPRPEPQEMGQYYPDDYKPFLTTVIGSETSIQKRSFKTDIVNFFRGDSKPLPNIGVGRMIEIGCASGAYLDEMSKKGWDVEGIEFSPTAAENARKKGFKIHTGPVEAAPEPSVSFDLITGWMVMEHLHEPLEVLKRLNIWTRKEGYFVFFCTRRIQLGVRVL